jgi:hypothetical protein
MNSRVGLLDLPLSSMRPVLELLQQENKLGVNQAHSREYVFYCTFQMELYAYQTIGESHACCLLVTMTMMVYSDAVRSRARRVLCDCLVVPRRH